MSTSSKIRLLLFLLALSFVGTAITLNKTNNKEKILEFEGSTIEKNLHKKERYVTGFLGDVKNFEALQSIERNEGLATTTIKKLRDRNNIFLHTYKNNKLVFWGARTWVPESDKNFKEGTSLLRAQNGWYLAVKRSSGNFSALCLIPVKSQYPFQNQYLRNTFSPDLISKNNIEIASLDDNHVYNIKSISGNYLFSVKLASSVTNAFYSTLELWMWALAIVFGSIWMTTVCIRIASKKRIKTAIGLLFIYFLVLRILTLESVWFTVHFNIPIFEPKFFSANVFFPSLGDFLLNYIAIAWFLIFVYNYRTRIRLFKTPPRKLASYVIFVLLGVPVALLALLTNHIFYELVTSSSINFDLTNILNLNGLSRVGIFLLCISVFNLYLLIEISLEVGKQVNLTNRERLTIFLSIVFILLALLIKGKPETAIVFFALILYMRGRAIYYHSHKEEYNLAIFIFTILTFAIISSLKLSDFQQVKEKEQQKKFALKLESSNDPNSVLLFRNLEEKINSDEFIINYFKSSDKKKYRLIEKLDQSYFEGYLDKYEFKVYAYAPDGKVFSQDSLGLDHFKDLVLSRAIKVTDYFYRINNSFGYQNYFAILPISSMEERLGTLVLELKAKTFQEARFPEILNNGQIDLNRDIRKYSFAYYNDGRLLYQYGPYIYSLRNFDFAGDGSGFVFKELNGFEHLIHQATSRKIIVVSRPVNTTISQLASVSFLFMVLIFFSIVVIFIYWLAVNFRDHEFRIHLFNWNYIISKNRILYRTRIQASMVTAIVSTLFIIGIISYSSIKRQFRQQHQSEVLNRINLMVDAFEKKMFENGHLVFDEETLRTFANINASDLELYSVNGDLIFSTQPKIYDYGLIASRINSLAYTYLNRYQRSEYIDREKIGGLTFVTAYKPIRNDNSETVAYISVPYYQYQRDIEDQIGSFLNTLINVYALVLVIIGLFAVFVAKKITYPLTIVQRSLAGIKIGSKNEPLTWKRNDEIGSLIKEYNNMIMALEDSTLKLARSERENAWREMAKQVAHEIKNPLTPLKLGVQLLEKSWREKDPNFEKKFERFSKSFIEQIESLSLIASEFSNFAKMPDSTYEDVKLQDVIDQSIEIYSKLNDLEVIFIDKSGEDLIVKGDRDQLLRVFNNLIKNAIEAIPDYKEGNVQISLMKNNGKAEIEVKDNGKGIPEALRDRIFHPNFTTKSSGTGLGLAFVKQAIENMMGSIRYSTEPDNGTTFYITLPLVTENTPQKSL